MGSEMCIRDSHQYPSVPGYPASHGCIRIFDRDAIVMYHFATLGTRVVIR